MKTTARILTILVALVATMFVAAPSANAGWACDRLGQCGVVWNSVSSNCYLRVSNGWSNGKMAGTIRRIAPGRGDPFRDADGFASVRGCKYRYTFNGGITWSKWRSTGHVKINDATTVVVQTRKR
jgi:hypothetical protein